jgi:hypothetical protein
VVRQSEGDAEKVEKVLDQGQIEEVLDAANDELSLLKKMVEWKPYEFILNQSCFKPDLSTAGKHWNINPSLVNGNTLERQPQISNAHIVLPSSRPNVQRSKFGV